MRMCERERGDCNMREKEIGGTDIKREGDGREMY
jgi:hypothetical protein